MESKSIEKLEEALEQQKSLMELEISNIRKTYETVIADLTERIAFLKHEKEKAAEVVFKENNGMKYRVATSKMKAFAEKIGNTSLYGGEVIDAHKDLRIPLLETYAGQNRMPIDSFDLVRSYITKFKPMMERIQSINKAENKRQREENYRIWYEHSPMYEADKLREQEEREKEEAIRKGLVQGPGGEWMTPNRLAAIHAEMGLGPDGEDYDTSRFATYP